ncbi:MAG: hypothetical protein M3Q99_14200 [Acidobacteriota bacterium]|nr:hypothetical protein [Acidobacteriota bacterium]
MIVFEWLKNWFENNEQILAEKKIEFLFSKLNENPDKFSQSVDIDTENKMARIDLWETGECDFDIIENETAKQLYWENRIIETEKDLFDFLNKGISEL